MTRQPPLSALSHESTTSEMARFASRQHLVRRTLPPILRREDLDFVHAVVSLRFDAYPSGGNIDDAIAHHAAIEQQVACRHEPVADMKRQQPFLSRPGDLCG